jgi:hypothetical protein
LRSEPSRCASTALLKGRDARGYGSAGRAPVGGDRCDTLAADAPTQPPAADHRPAAPAAALARGPGLAARADAQRGRAGADGVELPQRILQHLHVLSQPRHTVHGRLSRPPRRHPDADRRRSARVSLPSPPCRR